MVLVGGCWCMKMLGWCWWEDAVEMMLGWWWWDEAGGVLMGGCWDAA